MINSRRLKMLFRDLLDVYTPTGKEAGATAVLADFFRLAGVEPLLQPVDDDRDNLLVLPATIEPSLVFIGHVDTVAAPDWEHIDRVELGDRIEALGAADMKGGCAAMAEAYAALLEQGIRDLPVALAFVVGEEEDGDGTARLLEEWHFERAIVAEPTDLRPCFAHYGYIEARVRANGRRVHASVAPLGISPVADLLRFMLAIIEHLKMRGDGVIYNYRDLQSAPSGFAVPDWCETWLDLHLPPTLPPAPLLCDLEELLEAHRKRRPNFDAELTFTTVHEGFDLPQRGRFFELVAGAYRQAGLPCQPDSFRSHSDAALLWRAGTRTVVAGPGRLEEAHRSGEGVAWSQVEAAAGLFAAIMAASGQTDAS